MLKLSVLFLAFFFIFVFFNLVSSYSYASNKAFDFPVTYNKHVKKWIHYFQGKGRIQFQKWLNHSPYYLPFMREIFKKKGLPKDLASLAIIESGLSPHAVSSAKAVGYWQFMKPTATRFGLKMNWWLDERRDLKKSTFAAAAYCKDLRKIFRSSWYLSISAYNMGENRLLKLIRKYKTKNFWELSQKKDFPRETRNYIPQLLATIMILKNQSLYGFKERRPLKSKSYGSDHEYLYVPGGVDLHHIAFYLKIPVQKLTRLNSEIIKGFIPLHVKNHLIKVPKGYQNKILTYIKEQFQLHSSRFQVAGYSLTESYEQYNHEEFKF